MATTTLSKQMLEAHPGPAHVDRDLLARCIDECLACLQSCTACADANLAEEDVAEMRRCIRLCLDCADVCEATARLLSRQTDYLPETARA
jgi:ferredoxin